MSNNWKSKNRHKYLLQYHLILVCKYRKKLFLNQEISDDIKQYSFDICNRHNVIIREMETDKDHIYYMIDTEPNINLSNFTKVLKSYTTYHVWKTHYRFLRKQFWKENTFFTDGYFICSIGNVSESRLRNYIENQG